MTRRAHSRLCCAMVLRDIAHLLGGDGPTTVDEIRGVICGLAADLEIGEYGAVALHDSAYDRSGRP